MNWLTISAAATGAAADSFLRAWWPRLIIAAVLGLATLWWLWWRLPKRQVARLGLTDPIARANAEDGFRRTISQLFGGATVLVGAAWAYLQFYQQQQASREVLISNQVAKGFELLGNKEKDITQRLGGIYALEGVMNTSEQYYRPVLEALCAFVRDQTKRDTADTRDGPPSSDVQAALTVIGRRAVPTWMQEIAYPDWRVPKPDLGAARIPHADLRGAELRDAHLRRADLTNVDLYGADLERAQLAEATLKGTDLVDADLTDANLEKANLERANLTSASLDGTSFIGANLTGAGLGHLDLRRAYLKDADLTDVDLSYSDLGSAISQAQLDKACGTDVNLNPGLKLKPCPEDRAGPLR